MSELMQEIRELMQCDPTQENREKMRKLVKEFTIRKTYTRIKRLREQGTGGMI